MRGKQTLLWLLSILVLAALVWGIFRLAPGSKVNTAEVVLPTPVVTPTPGTEPDEGDNAQQQVLVDKSTIQAVVGAMSRADSYARTLIMESFWTTGAATKEVDVWVRGSNARFTVNEPKGVKHILILDGELWIWYDSGSEVYRGLAGDRDSDEYQGLLRYEDLLDIPQRDIREAGYVDYNGEACIYAHYDHGELGYTSKLWISVETGLLVSSETYDGETLIQRTTSLPVDVSTPDDEIFTHP